MLCSIVSLIVDSDRASSILQIPSKNLGVTLIQLIENLSFNCVCCVLLLKAHLKKQKNDAPSEEAWCWSLCKDTSEVPSPFDTCQKQVPKPTKWSVA